MKKILYFQAGIITLLTAILIVLILILISIKNNSRFDYQNEMAEMARIEKQFELKTECMQSEMDSLKENCCCHKEIEIEEGKTTRSFGSRGFSKPSPSTQKDEPKVVYNITNNTECADKPEEKPAGDCKNDSSKIIIKEYYKSSKKDTLLELYGSYDSVRYIHQYKDLSALKDHIDCARKEILWNSCESLLGTGLIAGGLFVPPIKQVVKTDVNLNVGGSIINTSVESIKYKTNPLKIGLITAGGIIVLDGLRRNIKPIKLLKKTSLEIDAYPTGMSFKIYF